MAFNPQLIFGALAAVMQKQSVTSVSMPDAHKAAGEVIAAVKSAPDIAIVPVKSPWLSKINWLQAAGIASSVAAGFGLNLPTDQIVAIVVGIQAVQSVVTVVTKTFFTNSVTASSAGKVGTS